MVGAPDGGAFSGFSSGICGGTTAGLTRVRWVGGGQRLVGAELQATGPLGPTGQLGARGGVGPGSQGDHRAGALRAERPQELGQAVGGVAWTVGAEHEELGGLPALR